MAEDYHGLISLPTPSVGIGDVGSRTRSGLGSMGRVPTMQNLPPVLSAWGMGGPALAHGLETAGKVFESMELDRQKIEAIQLQDQFQDAEREKLREIMERKGQGAANSVVDMEAFYAEQGRTMLASAKGTYQQGLYESFVKQRRASGLGLATNHEINEHENYKKEFLAGQADRRDQAIALNPESWQGESAMNTQQRRALNPYMEPGLANALDQKDRDESAYKAVLAKIDQGDLAGAEVIANQWRNNGATNDMGYVPPIAGTIDISSKFGPRDKPNPRASSNHQGTDIRVVIGTPVQSTSGGVVEFAGTKGGYGTTVMVKHDDGRTALYAHLSKAGAKVGGRVNPGDIIAFSGNSGNSTGPHLHYELRENGKAINPAKFLGLAKGKAPSHNPELSIKMDNAIKNAQNQMNAANKAGVQNFIGQAGNHMNALVNGGVGFEGYEDTLRDLVATGQVDATAAQKALGEFDEARAVYSVTNSDEGAYMSFGEASTALAELYPQPADLAPGEAETPERIAAMESWARTQALLAKQQAAFEASPLDAVTRVAEKNYQAMLESGTATGNETVDKINAFRDAAQRKGGYNNTQTSRLPVTTMQERNNLRSQYDSLESTKAKTDWYNQKSEQYGQYWPQAMSDANIDFGLALASMIPDTNRRLKEAALLADGRKPSDYGLTDTDAKNLKATVITMLRNDEGFFGVVDAIAQARFSDNLAAYRDNIRDTVTNMAAHYQSEGLSSKDAIAKVMDAFNQMAPANIISEDLALLSIPKEYNPDTITRGLVVLKDAMGATWDTDPVSGEPWEGPTFFRNHAGGVILDTPGDIGLSLTWDEIDNWGRRSRGAVGVAGTPGAGGRSARLAATKEAVAFVNEKLAQGSARPEPVSQVGVLPYNVWKAQSLNVKQAEKVAVKGAR